MLLTKLNNLEKVKIISRPSKVCKTPYVADIELPNGNIVQAHSASLGCCGLCEKDCYVLASSIESNCVNSKSKVCSYKIYLAHMYENKLYNNITITNYQLIGIDPKLAETLVESALKNNCFNNLKNIKKYRREAKLMNSRFDFIGIDENDKYFILEVKNVPLADYADVCAKDRKKMDFTDKHPYDKISYFPDGYRKNKGAVVSERALKHINELSEITYSKIIRPIICYVIQRTDINTFQASLLDPTYRDAYLKAKKMGVEIFTLIVEWNENGEAYFVDKKITIN